jgi:hypothetical protein
MKLLLSEHACGRVLLHLLCLMRDRKIRWHWAGMMRELRLIVP